MTGNHQSNKYSIGRLLGPSVSARRRRERHLRESAQASLVLIERLNKRTACALQPDTPLHVWREREKVLAASRRLQAQLRWGLVRRRTVDEVRARAVLLGVLLDWEDQRA